MVIGEYLQKLGDKNRIAFPNKFKLEIGNRLIVSRGYEGCLVIMSPAQWEELVLKEISGPFVSGLTRDTLRFLLAGAIDIELDTQGRFVIPAYLLNYSGISESAVFLGLGRWVELWSKVKWLAKLNDLEKDGSNIADKLAQIKF